MIRVLADQERSIRTVMVELDQFKYTLSQYEQPLKDLKASLDLENKKNRIDELDRAMEAPDFWTDAERSTKLSKEAKNLKDTVRAYNQVERKLEREPAAKVTGTNKDDSAVRQPVKKSAAKVYPNDPCPCGSGKKYKNCHGRA